MSFLLALLDDFFGAHKLSGARPDFPFLFAFPVPFYYWCRGSTYATKAVSPCYHSLLQIVKCKKPFFQWMNRRISLSRPKLTVRCRVVVWRHCGGTRWFAVVFCQGPGQASGKWLGLRICSSIERAGSVKRALRQACANPSRRVPLIFAVFHGSVTAE